MSEHGPANALVGSPQQPPRLQGWSGAADEAVAALLHAPAPLFGVSAAPEPIILFANEAFQRLTGYPESELVGLDFWRGFWPGHADEVEATALVQAKEDLAAGRAASLDFSRRRLGGPDAWMRLSLAPAHGPAGTILVGFETEIRPPVAGQADLQVLVQQTGALAHEFNNLLQVVVGYVTIILGALDKEEVDHRRIRRGAEAIQAATARAATLIRSLSDLVRR